MEPTLAGPRVIGTCESCKNPFSLAEELARRVSVLQCPHCNEPLVPIDSLERVPGQSIAIQQISSTTKLRRGEIVAFEDSLPTSAQDRASDSQHASRQLKRLVGFPSESIRISDGDLLIDGHRFQKSADDFYKMSVHVNAWPEAIDYLSRKIPPSPFMIYQSTSLWPRTSAQIRKNPSPILDELPLNADEPFEFTSVHDIGLVIELEQYPAVGSDLAIGIWSRGFLRSVQLQFSDNQCVVVPCVQLQNNSGAAMRYVYKSTSVRFFAAIVDGRLMVAFVDREGSAIGSAAWDVHECLDASDRFMGADVSSERPIAISLRGGILKITSLDVVRDVHYRGPRGESEYALPIVNAIHVLGDNVSISSDSRSELSAGIDRVRITGRLIAASQ